MTKENKAIIRYNEPDTGLVIVEYEYNSKFSFMETPSTIIFLINDVPVKIINRDFFINLTMVYKEDVDEVENSDFISDNVMKFPN